MKLTVWVTATWSKYRKEFDYNVYGSDPKIFEEIPVTEVEIEFESPPDKALRLAQHALLMKQRQKVRADAEVKANELLQEANELLALEDHSND